MARRLSRDHAQRLAQEILANRVATVREARRLSQGELARISGVPQPTIARVESGVIKSPGAAILKRLAEALSTPVDDLLGSPLPGARRDDQTEELGRLWPRAPQPVRDAVLTLLRRSVGADRAR